MSTPEEILEHFGVKGMRWGQRKARTKVSTASEDFKTVADLRKKKTRELTNKELKIANERLNLEQNFNRMNPGTLKKGTAAASTVLATAGIAVAAYNMVKSPAGQALVKAGKRAMRMKQYGQLKLF